MKFVLRVQEHMGQTFVVPIDRRVMTVGRMCENDLVLPKDNVSKRQMYFVFRQQRFWAVDLKSCAGIYVNECHKSQPHPLQIKQPDHGEFDTVRVGDFFIVLEMLPEQIDTKPLDQVASMLLANPSESVLEQALGHPDIPFYLLHQMIYESALAVLMKLEKATGEQDLFGRTMLLAKYHWFIGESSFPSVYDLVNSQPEALRIHEGMDLDTSYMALMKVVCASPKFEPHSCSEALRVESFLQALEAKALFIKVCKLIRDLQMQTAELIEYTHEELTKSDIQWLCRGLAKFLKRHITLKQKTTKTWQDSLEQALF